MLSDVYKKRIRIVLGVLAGVIFVLYAGFHIFFTQIPSVTSLAFTLITVYVLATVAWYWERSVRKFGTGLLGIGIFLFMMSSLFFSMAEKKEAIIDSLIIEGLSRGAESQLGLDITPAQMQDLLSHCTPQNLSIICLSYQQAKSELGGSFDKVIEASFQMNTTPPEIQRVIDEAGLRDEVTGAFEFDQLGRHNRDLGGLFIIIGLLLLAASWFIEHSYEALAKGISASIFFSVAGVFVTFKLIQFIFVFMPESLGLVRDILIDILKKEALHALLPLILTGILWMGVNLGLIWYFYPKLRKKQQPEGPVFKIADGSQHENHRE